MNAADRATSALWGAGASGTMARGIGRVAVAVLVTPIRLYRRLLSPLKATPSCRFHPTCSAYAEEAIVVHGPVRGSWMAVRRLFRCHPFHPGGLDPVPPARSHGTRRTEDA